MGRPKCTTRRQDLFIRTTALRRRTTNATRLKTELRTAANINVSQQTIRNRLYSFNLRSRAAAVRIPLTQAHCRARFAWCRLHKPWTRQLWGQVLFIDESRNCLCINDARERAWRRSGECYTDACVRQHDRYGGGSIMVWGGIHLHGRTSLHLVVGNMTA